jgi:hypothetical protein
VSLQGLSHLAICELPWRLPATVAEPPSPTPMYTITSAYQALDWIHLRHSRTLGRHTYRGTPGAAGRHPARSLSGRSCYICFLHVFRGRKHSHKSTHTHTHTHTINQSEHCMGTVSPTLYHILTHQARAQRQPDWRTEQGVKSPKYVEYFYVKAPAFERDHSYRDGWAFPYRGQRSPVSPRSAPEGAAPQVPCTHLDR